MPDEIEPFWKAALHVIGPILGLFLAAIIVGAAYESLDNAGWMSHDHTVNMFMKDDWLVGENRTCMGIQSPGTPTKKAELASLFCPEDYVASTPHNISIKFWGRIDRPTTELGKIWGERYDWQCTRTSEGFVCKAIN